MDNSGSEQLGLLIIISRYCMK